MLQGCKTADDHNVLRVLCPFQLLDVKHKKLQVMEVSHLDEIRNLEERLSRDESTVQGLKQELVDKENHLKKLRASVNEVIDRAT